MITEKLDASNKFIVNNLYNNNLTLNGSLTINSNLIVLGDTTQLDTVVYTTERLEIVNANNTSTALMIQQNTAYRDIFIASNMNTAVFRIANNGDVHINGEGVYKRNNRDVILDTSNYVLSSSNNLINYALTLNNKGNTNDANTSNYILSTSNNLINYVLTSSNTLIDKANFNDANSSNYILSTSNNLINYVLTSSNTLINKANFNDANSSNYILSTSNNLINYVLTSSNTLINKANFNDANMSNYVLSTSNIISKRITDLTTDMITEKINASNKFIVNNLYNNNLEVNGTLTINSNLIVLGDTTQLNTIVYTTERLEIVNANNTSTALMVQQNTADRDIFVASNINTAVFRIANNGDVHINGSGVYKRNNRDVILDTSNYILSTSNNLINYVLTSSNTLINKAIFNDTNTSNYILSTSNNLINYVLTSSNTLIDKANFNDANSSNYILSTSNNLINYVLASSNTLIDKANFNDANISNYILSTSNIISKRITDLRTDMITETIDASNKFIVNNQYNDDLILNGTLTINSNLIVLGDTTQLNTIVYTTERLEIINANNTSTALMVQQNTADRDIFVASNINTAVFKIANNGDVHINGNYKKNNRDIILDTSNYVLSINVLLEDKVDANDNNVSNYVLSTSNILSERLLILDQLTSNVVNNSIATLNVKVDANDNNVSNYVLSTSNILSERLLILDQLTSNVVNNSIATLNVKVDANDTNVSNYVLSTSNNLLQRIKTEDDYTSNYIFSVRNFLIDYNNLINKPDASVSANDANASNYVLSTSNIISNRISDLTTDMITEKMDASHKFIVNNLYNNNLEVNGTLTINSNLIVLGDTTQLNTIVYTTERLEVVNANNTSTALMVQQNTTDRDIFVASNINTAVFRIANNGDVLINGTGNYKKNNRDVILDTSNYVLSTSNNLILKANLD